MCTRKRTHKKKYIYIIVKVKPISHSSFRSKSILINWPICLKTFENGVDGCYFQRNFDNIHCLIQLTKLNYTFVHFLPLKMKNTNKRIFGLRIYSYQCSQNVHVSFIHCDVNIVQCISYLFNMLYIVMFRTFENFLKKCYNICF